MEEQDSQYLEFELEKMMKIIRILRKREHRIYVIQESERKELEKLGVTIEQLYKI